jgi:hypothetical protein
MTYVRARQYETVRRVRPTTAHTITTQKANVEFSISHGVHTDVSMLVSWHTIGLTFRTRAPINATAMTINAVPTLRTR